MSGSDPTAPKPGRQSASVDDVVDGVISYAKSQTIGPLRGAGRWVAWGALGALAIGVGGSLALLGLLRLIQSEWGSVSGESSRLSWLPYLIVFVVGAAFVGLALAKINRSHLLGGKSNEETR
jgi:peptidoglycan biosynthesis protein MviN/MurJ (putative lipid II flippase)